MGIMVITFWSYEYSKNKMSQIINGSWYEEDDTSMMMTMIVVVVVMVMMFRA